MIVFNLCFNIGFYIYQTTIFKKEHNNKNKFKLI